MNTAVATNVEELLYTEDDVDENNNVFLSSLKPVFEACDYNGDGYVRVQDLIDLGQQYTNTTKDDELSPILQQLDANGDGRITFEEFCDKVPTLLRASSTISNSSDTTNTNTNTLDFLGEGGGGEEGGGGGAGGTEGLEDFHHPVKINYPEEDEEEDEEHRASRARSYTDSEGFFEENDIETNSTTSNDLCREEDTASTPYKNFIGPSSYFNNIQRNSVIYSTYPPNGKKPRQPPHSVYDLQRHQLSRTSEYQSQEDTTSNYDEDGLCPIQMNQSGLSNHRLSGSIVANRLREVKSAQNSVHGSMEDMSSLLGRRYSNSECELDYSNLSDQIKTLSSQVLLMKMNQESHEDKQKKIREENRNLVNRINVLEEQLIDQKNQSIETVEAEGQKYQKQLTKLQRDHEDSIEELQQKIREAEQEIENLKSVEPMLKKELEITLEERRLAQQRIEVLQKELLEKEKEVEQLKYKLMTKNEELERHRTERAEEVLLLSQQIENLKFMQNAARNTFDEREDYLNKMEMLRKDNDDLKQHQDELRNQLIEKSTMINMKEEKSLADELVTADKSDVLTALRTQEHENHRLRQYIDQLLSLILQSDPMLLEK